jgi:hypothetical protein
MHIPVATHKATYFSSAWANYETARKGTLRLIPPQKLAEELEKDYELMEAMFFRKKTSWALILKNISEFESKFNEATT